MMPANRHIGALMTLLATAWFSPCYAQGSGVGGDFTLTDQNEKPFRLQQLRGKVVLLFFGYTFCPDICPIGLTHLSMLLNELGDEADRVQGVFITIDPERDSPRVLRQYLGYFNKNLIGLTGSQHEIDRVVVQFRVKVQKRASADDRYTMDHSASLYMIDQTGKLSTVVPYGFPPEHVLRLVRHLLHNHVDETGEHGITGDPAHALLSEDHEMDGDLRRRAR
jgi:cytochrome oxidase Cu insertion factor (SCO1/SenC/PrrC family)